MWSSADGISWDHVTSEAGRIPNGGPRCHRSLCGARVCVCVQRARVCLTQLHSFSHGQQPFNKGGTKDASSFTALSCCRALFERHPAVEYPFPIASHLSIRSMLLRRLDPFGLSNVLRFQGASALEKKAGQKVKDNGSLNSTMQAVCSALHQLMWLSTCQLAVSIEALL